MPFSRDDLQSLQTAKNLLENPGLTARLTALIGSPIEAAMQKLPDKVTDKLGDVLESALLKVANTATYTLRDHTGKVPRNKAHALGVAVTGGLSGFLGPVSMLLEVPVTTGIMFRSIADIARSQGESARDPETRLACIEVFGLGGGSDPDEGLHAGYYAVRAALTQQLRTAASYSAKLGSDTYTSTLVDLIRKVAKRLGVHYSSKLAAQLVPVLGAVTGASVNTLFINHYQNMAEGHFTIRRLERKYDPILVREIYGEMPKMSKN